MQKAIASTVAASACGALIGGLAAFELAHLFSFGWVVGALLGGVAGYITADLKGFYTGAALAYRHTIAWRPHVLYWKTAGMLITAYIGSTASLFLFIGAPLATIAWHFGLEGTEIRNLAGIILGGITAMYLFIFFLIMGVATAPEYKKHSLQKLYEETRDFVIISNPYCLTIWLCQGLWWLVVNAPSWVPAAGHQIFAALAVARAFIRRTFNYTITDERLTCFIAASLGAPIGYFCGSALFGTLTGGVGGLVLALYHKSVDDFGRQDIRHR